MLDLPFVKHMKQILVVAKCTENVLILCAHAYLYIKKSILGYDYIHMYVYIYI